MKTALKLIKKGCKVVCDMNGKGCTVNGIRYRTITEAYFQNR